MAPELFSDEGVYSFYSDFWAFGCILFEMATGKPPFSAKGLKELIVQIEEQDTPQVPDFSPVFNDLLKVLLEKDPIKRTYWDQLRKHPFWKKEITPRKLPAQPQFDAYLKKRKVDPVEFYATQERNQYFMPSVAFQKPRKADPMRISTQVRLNQISNEQNYQANVDRHEDVMLTSRDQTINFGKNKAQEEEDEITDDMQMGLPELK